MGNGSGFDEPCFVSLIVLDICMYVNVCVVYSHFMANVA